MYTCPQCKITSSGLRCKGCHQWLTRDIPLIEAFLDEPDTPARPFKWGTALAHWGDALSAMSLCRWSLDQLGQPSCGMVYYGPDPAIPEFMEAQSWIDQVIYAKSNHGYTEVYYLATRDASKAVDPWWDYLQKQDDSAMPPREEVWPTHMVAVTGYQRKTHVLPADQVCLPKSRETWANLYWKEHGLTKQDGVFLLNPSSTWSAGPSEHWPHWEEAILWLLEETPFTYVLVGLNPMEGLEHPRLFNLIGQTPTNMEVFALAELSDGVITTCNSLSLWTVIKGLPAIVGGNGAIVDRGNHFRRYIDRLPNVYLNPEDPLEQFQILAKEWLPSPLEWVENARKRLGVQRSSTVEIVRTESTWRVLQGIVSGTKADLSQGTVARDSEIRGDPLFYRNLGMLELVDQRPSVTSLVG